MVCLSAARAALHGQVSEKGSLVKTPVSEVCTCRRPSSHHSCSPAAELQDAISCGPSPAAMHATSAQMTCFHPSRLLLVSLTLLK